MRLIDAFRKKLRVTKSDINYYVDCTGEDIVMSNGRVLDHGLMSDGWEVYNPEIPLELSLLCETSVYDEIRFNKINDHELLFEFYVNNSKEADVILGERSMDKLFDFLAKNGYDRVIPF